MQRDQETRDNKAVSPELEKEYEKAKKETLPRVVKESDEGVRPFIPVEFQPVRSPEHYESEFGVKGNDIIFHFWPWNYHLNEKSDRPTRSFARGFETFLVQAMGDAFDIKRVEISKDEDMGAYFVKANGYATNQFHRDLCIRACEKLHNLLGG
jgi:hypothetical protein